jgi:hypothetical protein
MSVQCIGIKSRPHIRENDPLWETLFGERKTFRKPLRQLIRGPIHTFLPHPAVKEVDIVVTGREGAKRWGGECSPTLRSAQTSGRTLAESGEKEKRETKK